MDRDVEAAARLDAARNGAAWALSALYETHHPPLLRYLAANRPGDAVESAASVWRDVAAGLEEFDGDERAFRVWLFALARARGCAGLSTQSAGIVRELDLSVQQALERIASLADDERDVVLLQAVGRLSADEVAEVIGRTTTDVRALQQRALRTLIATRRSEQVVA